MGPNATIDVDQALHEAADVGVETGRLAIDPQAMVIEDCDKGAETALVSGIGSTGKGSGADATRRITGLYLVAGLAQGPEPGPAA